jgi:hypothetical protein
VPGPYHEARRGSTRGYNPGLLLLLLFIDQLELYASASPLRFPIFTRLSFIELRKPLPTAVRDAGTAPRRIFRANEGQEGCPQRTVETTASANVERNLTPQCCFLHLDLRQELAISQISAAESTRLCTAALKDGLMSLESVVPSHDACVQAHPSSLFSQVTSIRRAHR